MRNRSLTQSRKGAKEHAKRCRASNFFASFFAPLRLCVSLLLFALLLASCTSKPAGPLAFVTNERDGTITVIDTGSNEVVGTIKAGDGPWGIAL